MGVLDTGWVDVTVISDPLTKWTTPNNAKISNDSYASFTSSSSQSQDIPLIGNTLGLSIPVAAIIVGIELRIEVKSSVSSLQIQLEATKDGVRGAGETFYFTLSTSDTLYIAGGSSNLLSSTWTPAELNDSNFGVRFNERILGSGLPTRTFYIDNMSVKVYYTFDRDIPDSGHGTETSTLFSATIPVSEVGHGTEAIDSGIIYITDTGHGTDFVRGHPELIETGRGIDSIYISYQTVPIQDYGYGISSMLQNSLIDIQETGAGVDIDSLFNSVSIEDLSAAIDYLEADPGFSSAIIRFTGGEASIKFTGYREEVQ